MSLILELMAFLKQRKKIWLAPLIFLFVFIGGLLIIAQGSALGPLIYTLF